MSKPPSFLSRLFGKAPPSQSDAVREVLADSGDRGAAARPTDFFFYDGDPEALAVKAKAAGYDARPTAKQPGVILSKSLPVNEDAFEPIEAQMEAWAEEFGCEFDGWETQVVRN